ncbi:27 kDa hemolymph protein-like [Leguminivora glycinivorella]|uniref:27 kDa hemolymph protein-like n=1 Tax=Leguminivora glycinivorella TaxID=1035111 RepID=UPI0020101EA2|nr:27 kDa hemolymph protein-like [Leguminivora glycinivorella]XP_047986570.1 27 kDa hemolymph protein-like [Leguminivora glycinivorella]
MIWIISLLVAIAPILTIDAWGYNAVDRREVTEYVTKLCMKGGAEDKVPQVLDAIENFEKCSVSLFKDEALLEEVATSIRNNDLREVFKKYCARKDRLAACSYTLIDNLGLCIVGANLPIAHKFVDQVLGFVCDNEGSRIGMFIKEGGPQCFQQHSSSLKECAERVLGDIDGVQTNKQRCSKFDEISICLSETMTGCTVTTPGDMTRAFLANVRMPTPCPPTDSYMSYMRWLQNRDLQRMRNRNNTEEQ